MAKVVKVFLSSTFRDMNAERDVLIKNVFPRVQEEASKYDITICPVDLRWGVTEEQAKRGEVVERCLDAIEEARPYFIGLLGKRYGWIPTPSHIRTQAFEGILSKDLLDEAEKTLLQKGYCYKDTYGYKLDQELDFDTKTRIQQILAKADFTLAKISTTEQEIDYVLSEDTIPVFIRNLDILLQEKGVPESERKCIEAFYRYNNGIWQLTPGIDKASQKDIRNVLERIQPKLTHFHNFFFFRQDVGETHSDYFENDASSQESLSKLKEKIIQSSKVIAIEDYPCSWNESCIDFVKTQKYPIQDLKTFEDMVYHHLCGHICSNKELISDQTGLKEYEEENILHNRFVEVSSQNFYGREKLLETLSEKVDLAFSGTLKNAEKPTQYIAVTGEPGSGKSAFMAKFAKVYSQKENVIVLSRFIGITPKSTSTIYLLQNICQTLATEEIETPYVLEKLRSLLIDLAKKRNGKVLLVLDALNQLDSSLDMELRWLAGNLPQNMCIVTSMVQDKRAKRGMFDIEADKTVIESMKAKNAYFLEITKLSVLEKKTIINFYLHKYNKELAEDLLLLLASKEESYNPLYLVAALEELRMWGHHEQLEDFIKNRLPETVVDLFAFILSRIEKELQERFAPNIQKNVFRSFMELMAVGRYGIREEDALYLLGDWEKIGQAPLPSLRLPDLYWSEIRRSMTRYLTLRGEYWNFFHRQLEQAVIRKYLEKKGQAETVQEMLVNYMDKMGFSHITTIKELPYHLHTLSDNTTYSDQLSEVLCDLDFIHHKVTKNLSYELLEDYTRLKTLPFSVKPYLTFVRRELGNFQKYYDVDGFVYQQAFHDNALSHAAKKKFETFSGTLFCNRYEKKQSPLIAGYKIFDKEVEYISFGKEKNIAAVSFEDRTVKIFDLDRGIELFDLVHNDICRRVEVSSDGKMAASSIEDTIWLWDLQTGELINKWRVNKIEGKENLVHTIYALAFYKNLLLVGIDLGNIQVFELKTYKQIEELKGERHLNSFKVSDNGTLAATYGRGGVTAWDINSFELLNSFDIKERYDYIVGAISANGEKVLIICKKYGQFDALACNLWDVKAGKLLHVFETEAYGASITPDGKYGVFFYELMELWNLETFECVKKWENETYRCYNGKISPDGKTLYTGSRNYYDGSIYVWDLTKNMDTKSDEKRELKKASFSDEIRFDKYYSTLEDNLEKIKQVPEFDKKNTLAKIWDRERDELVSTIDMGCSVSEIAVSEKHLLAIGRDLKDRLAIWDLHSGKLLHKLSGHYDGIYSLSITPDSSVVVTSGKDGVIILWDPSTGKMIQQIQRPVINSRGARESIPMIQITPNGKYFVYRTGGYSNAVVYEVDSKSYLNLFPTPILRKVAISPCGKYVMATSGKGRYSDGRKFYALLTVWRVSLDGKRYKEACEEMVTKEYYFRSEDHKDLIDSIGFSQDGKFAFSSSRDGVTILWNLETAKKVAVYQFAHPVKKCILNGPTLPYAEDIDYIDIVSTSKGSQVAKAQDVIKPEVTIPVIGLASNAKPFCDLAQKAQTPEEKIEFYTKAIECDAKYSMAYYNRGLQWKIKGEYDKAIADYTKTIELTPDYAMAYYKRANLLKNLDAKIQDYNKSIELDPTFAYAYNNRGNVWHDKKEYDKAIADYNKVLEIDPADEVALTCRGITLQAKGDVDRAMKDYTKAISINKSYSSPYLRRAEIWYDNNRLDEAIADYTEFLELRPEAYGIYVNRGNAFFKKGDIDNALRDYLTSTSCKLEYYLGHYSCGLAFHQKGRYKDAIKYFTLSLKYNDNHVMSYFQRGRSKKENGDIEGALEDFATVLDLQPKNADAHYQRSVIFYELGELEQAAWEAKKAAKLDKKYASLE